MIALPDAYAEVVRIAKGGDVQSCWRDLLRFLSRHAVVDNLAAVAIDDDVRRVREQLTSLLAKEPPDFPVAALYFGLFDAAGERGGEEIGFYVAGVDRYDPNGPDCLCNPTWWPEGRYLASDALAEVKLAELSASGKERAFIGYAGQLGVALVVAKFASVNLLSAAIRVVGFDSGDFAELAA
jgi:hypothetical protein